MATLAQSGQVTGNSSPLGRGQGGREQGGCTLSLSFSVTLINKARIFLSFFHSTQSTTSAYRASSGYAGGGITLLDRHAGKTHGIIYFQLFSDSRKIFGCSTGQTRRNQYQNGTITYSYYGILFTECRKRTTFHPKKPKRLFSFCLGKLLFAFVHVSHGGRHFGII